MNHSLDITTVQPSAAAPEVIPPGPSGSLGIMIEAQLGRVEWRTTTKGFCKCPGEHLHTTRTGAKDCAVFLNSVPTVYCLHQNCKEIVAEASRALRRSINSGVIYRGQKSVPASSGIRYAKQSQEVLAARSVASLPQILENYSWALQSIKNDSLANLDAMPPEDWSHLIISLFQSGDNIWIGEPYSSGDPKHLVNFGYKAKWLRTQIRGYHFICPSTFRPGTFERKNENVWFRRFLVVESDVLGKDEVGSIFRWLREAVGMSLKAVVDTAGKSLHGWFVFPPEDVFAELKIVLPQLKCDPGMFGASQPCRLPGVRRNGKMQSLIYLNPTPQL